MYTPEQIQKAKTKIVKDLANGKSLSAIIRKGQKQNTKTPIPSRPIIYEWLNPNHDKFDANFLNNYNTITISSKNQQSKFCKSNPKGSRATSYDDYRIKNARTSNKKRFPNSNIYIIKIPILNYYKIGVSQRTHIRVKSIQSNLPFESELILNVPKNNTYDLEELIHEQYKEKYIKSEWFILNDSEIKNIIKSISKWDRIDNTAETK